MSSAGSDGGGVRAGGSAGGGSGTATPTGVAANRLRRGFYLDSVALMRLSTSLSARAGVETASLMIGTPANLAILEEAGLLTDAGRAAGPNDLVLAIRATDEEALAAAFDAAEAGLAGAAGAGSEPGGRAVAAVRLPGLRAACEALPGANLAIVSVPGPYAAREARRALALGLDVLVFSDNVPVEDEVSLKREARARGRMVMGPDCGTALIAGTPLAFANRVRKGDIGAIAASGTGLQEISVLVHRGGGGISHGIGVGGRDLGDEVGGLGTFMALEALEADPGTRHIVIVSKPPGPRTEQALLTRLAGCPKGVTLCLIGRDRAALPANVALAPTLRDAARLALGEGKGRAPRKGEGGGGAGRDEPPSLLAAPRAAGRPLPPPRSGRIVGLFSGGTLCAEGQAVLLRAGLGVASNAPVPGAARLAPGAGGGGDPSGAIGAPPGHAFIDLGADEFTAGRPHPMIEPTLRSGALGAALADPAVAVIVLDVVLGTGSHPDPAGPLVDALRATAGASRPTIVASVCGTELDPQDYAAQRRALEAAGVFVADSNADAVEVAVRIAATADARGSGKRGGNEAAEPAQGEGGNGAGSGGGAEGGW